MTNPLRIVDEDGLFDIFDSNRGSPIKYFLIHNPNNFKNLSQQMTLEQKLFRKFFYENSQFMDSEVYFVEVTDPELAKKFGIQDQHSIAAVQNKNKFDRFANAEDVKLFNLSLEMVKLPQLDVSKFEASFIRDTSSDRSTYSFQNWLLSNPEALESVFSHLSNFI